MRHEAFHPDKLSYFFAHCNVPDQSVSVYDMPTMIKQFM